MNQFKGEVKVKLFGEEYTLRPDIESICEIEDAAKGETSVGLMLVQSHKRVITFKTIALVLYGCLAAKEKRGEIKLGGKFPTIEGLLAEVRKNGVAEYVAPVGMLLGAMVTPEEAEAEEKNVEPEPVAKPA